MTSINITKKEIRELQSEVMAYWEKDGKKFQEREDIGSGQTETRFLAWAERILDNSSFMLDELGIDSIEEWRKSKEPKKEHRHVELLKKSISEIDSSLRGLISSGVTKEQVQFIYKLAEASGRLTALATFLREDYAKSS